jgi:DNA-binding beta-propeller fold protein YncE
MKRSLLAGVLLAVCVPAQPAGAEIFVASDGAVLVFADDADGDVAPLRAIAGVDTLLSQPTNVTLDLVHRELFVADSNQILVFPMDAQGNVAPLRAIAGGATLLQGTRGMAIDPVADELYIACTDANAVRVFDRAAGGDVAPLRLVEGASTGLAFSTGIVSSRARECSAGRAVDGCRFRDGFERGSTCDWDGGTGAPACG